MYVFIKSFPPKIPHTIILVEGVATQHRIYQMLLNSDDGEELGKKLREFFSLHLDHLRYSIRNNPTDTYWQHIDYVLHQMEGMLAGYMSVAPKDESLDIMDLMRLNMDGDRFDLSDALNRGFALPDDLDSDSSEKLTELNAKVSNKRSGASLMAQAKALKLDSEIKNFMKLREEEEHLQYSKLVSGKERQHRLRDKTLMPSDIDSKYEAHHRQVMDMEEKLWHEIALSGRCTAIVRLTEDNKDLLVAHTSWEGYEEMLRIYKKYDIALLNNKADKLSFSSYPGMLSSTDDWYITSAGLLITETTLEIVDSGILRNLGPEEGVASWIRTIVASRLADNGNDWSELYSEKNSGTYNCQWMIIDYKLFKSGEPLVPGTFYVVETLPLLAHIEDMSSYLQGKQVFPSSNRPMFQDIRDFAGYPSDRIGGKKDFFSYDTNPRNMMIVRDAPSVNSLEDIKYLIRKNDYKNDPLSNGYIYIFVYYSPAGNLYNDTRFS
jgi:hypothetical protein